MAIKTLDFTHCDFGLLVTRSEHFKKDRCVKPRAKKEIGIIVEKKFYPDKIAESGYACWPVVHWEGSVSSSSVHPCLIVPLREKYKRKLPTIEMED